MRPARARGTQAADQRMGSLTPAECDVVNLGRQDMSNKDVATRFFISPRTVGSISATSTRRIAVMTFRYQANDPWAPVGGSLRLRQPAHPLGGDCAVLSCGSAAYVPARARLGYDTNLLT